MRKKQKGSDKRDRKTEAITGGFLTMEKSLAAILDDVSTLKG